MNAIFGIIHWNDQPVSPDELSVLAAPELQAGHLSTTTFHPKNAAFAGWNTIPRPAPDRPSLIITGYGRLDNRTGLLEQFSMPASSQMTDWDLICRAYGRWQEETPAHLHGDWAFAAYDETQKRLFLARDHAGNTGLFYYAHPNGLIFASHLRRLLKLAVIPKRLNTTQLAHRLSLLSGSDPFGTAYEQIRRLPPAHALTATPENIQIQRYWRLEDLPPASLPSYTDYQERFLDLFSQAVQIRCDTAGQTGLQLSSGLDSSAMAAVAAPHLAGAGLKLYAFTSLPLSVLPEPLFKKNNEKPGVEKIIQSVGNIQPTFFSELPVGYLDVINRILDLTGEPQHAIANFPWVLTCLEKAAELGVTRLLNGQMGNLIISWNAPEFTLQLLRSGQWRRALAFLQDYHSANQISWLRTFYRQVVSPLTQRRDLSKRTIQNQIRASALNPAFLPASGFLEHLAGQNDTQARTPQEKRLEMLTYNKSGSLWHSLTHAYPLSACDPCTDYELMSFCLSVPDWVWMHNSMGRSLIRTAFTGRLPREILFSRQRAQQGSDLIFNLRNEVPELRRQMETLQTHDTARRMLNLPLMRAVLDSLQASFSVKLTTQCNNILLNGLMVGQCILNAEN